MFKSLILPLKALNYQTFKSNMFLLSIYINQI